MEYLPIIISGIAVVLAAVAALRNTKQDTAVDQRWKGMVETKIQQLENENANTHQTMEGLKLEIKEELKELRRELKEEFQTLIKLWSNFNGN
jgi:hypothetical protein